MSVDTNKKRGFKLPSAYTIPFTLITLVTAWLIPPGWIYGEPTGVSLALNSSYNQSLEQHQDEIDKNPNFTTVTSILVYADDPIHLNTYVVQALDELGLDYTNVGSDMARFEDGLINEGPWDLVVFANDVSPPPNTVFDVLDNYVQNGGRLIMHTFYMDNISDHRLWDSLGVNYIGTIVVSPGEKAAPMYWWDSSHPVFTVPETVPEFQKLVNPLVTEWPVQFGVAPLPGYEPLAGYTENLTQENASLVIGNDGYTVFRGFVDFINNEDLDTDGKPDGVELWVNLISNVLMAVRPPGSFDKLVPNNNATGQPGDLTLDWEGSLDAASYEYCYDTTNDDACEGSWTSTTNTSASITGLDNETTYYWQVRAVNTGGTTYANNDTWWNFTTIEAAPGTFSKTSPTNGATNQPTSMSLSWGSSAGADSYEYCYDLVDNSTCDAAWTNVGAVISAAVNGLVYNTSYYWQVRAVNTAATTEANSGAWWNFRTRRAFFVFLPVVLR
jgi:hypothetical protein